MSFSFNFSGDDIEGDDVTTEVSARAAAMNLQGDTGSRAAASAEESRPKRENIKELVSYLTLCFDIRHCRTYPLIVYGISKTTTIASNVVNFAIL